MCEDAVGKESVEAPLEAALRAFSRECGGYGEGNGREFGGCLAKGCVERADAGHDDAALKEGSFCGGDGDSIDGARSAAVDDDGGLLVMVPCAPCGEDAVEAEGVGGFVGGDERAEGFAPDPVDSLWKGFRELVGDVLADGCGDDWAVAGLLLEEFDECIGRLVGRRGEWDGVEDGPGLRFRPLRNDRLLRHRHSAVSDVKEQTTAGIESHQPVHKAP